ncbi:hypothetical protein [Streptomyces sp. MS2.AVA.5]|uniref:Uncharacterized protein n=1 Tax=Streptomyces achmelvichensis TaxID=3134111 RepID=A0ACC6PL20_9ACTN
MDGRELRDAEDVGHFGECDRRVVVEEFGDAGEDFVARDHVAAAGAAATAGTAAGTGSLVFTDDATRRKDGPI